MQNIGPKTTKQIILFALAMLLMENSFALEKKGDLEKEFPFYYKKSNQVENTNLKQDKSLEKYFSDKSPDGQLFQQSITPIPSTLYNLSGTHTDFILTGFGIVSYTDLHNHHGSFNMSKFDPTFLFRYQDKFMWESQLEFTLDEDGDAEIGIPYAYADWFIYPNVILLGGKFLSPLGKFVNYYYLPWLNKLASIPAGFGYDSAAPQADIGLQLRGIFNCSQWGEFHYAFFIANGPKIELEDDNIVHIATDGYPIDLDGHKIYGGRISFIPIKDVELGISYAAGEAGLLDEDELVDTSLHYSAFGVDFSAAFENFNFIAEYISQEVPTGSLGVLDRSYEFNAWYAQISYLFFQKLEGVVRIGRYDSPNVDETQRQLAIGLDYWFTTTIGAKFTYEINHGEETTPADEDRILFHFVFGF